MNDARDLRSKTNFHSSDTLHMTESIAAPFQLLTALFGDAAMAHVFSVEQTIQAWLDVEIALAEAQHEAGILTAAEVSAIRAAAVPANVDVTNLISGGRIVGYPILPLVREITTKLDHGRLARMHYGATTQDIMDSALAIQLRNAVARLDELLDTFGESLAELVGRHRETAMMGRTHAQHATPTTFGAKLAVFLDELTRHRHRLAEALPRIARVSLFGAAGTSAALGSAVASLRRSMGKRLDLVATDVPWHVARDSVAEFGLICGMVGATSARFAREVIDLSRSEVGEVQEQGGYHRGASSTMPQKSNPIGSEAIIGMSATAGALAGGLFRAMEANHERAAGEWQIEWQVIPNVAYLAASCLSEAASIGRSLQVFPDIMRANLDNEGGFALSEAYMMALAPAIGREAAHDLVYQAVLEARRSKRSLHDQLAAMDDKALKGLRRIESSEYLGEAPTICDAALSAWRVSQSAALLRRAEGIVADAR
jgi:3-carboxy-cis,cis-muconate cycloisomerase